MDMYLDEAFTTNNCYEGQLNYELYNAHTIN